MGEWHHCRETKIWPRLLANNLLHIELDQSNKGQEHYNKNTCIEQLVEVHWPFNSRHYMNSVKLVIPLHFISWKNSFCDISRKCVLPNMIRAGIRLYSLYWSIHTKDESKRGTAFAFIFGVNWLWRCGVSASFGVFSHEIKCNGVTSFMEFMSDAWMDRWIV